MYNIVPFSSQYIPQLLTIAPKFVDFYKCINYNKESVENALYLLSEKGLGFLAIKNDKVVGLILGMWLPILWSGEIVLQELAWWVEEEERNTSVGILLLKTFEDQANGSKVVMSILPQTPIKEHTMNRLGYVKTEESYVRV